MVSDEDPLREPDPPQPSHSSRLTGVSENFGFGDGGQQADLEPGTDLGGLTIVRLIAEGGMGRVYEGRQSTPDRRVAVKVMRSGTATPQLLRRFEHEAEVLGRLRHPGIAQIFAMGTYQAGAVRVPYLVMEFIPDARPITRHAQDLQLSVVGKLELFRRVCEAVAHGHASGVIHRDLKPGNILVEPSGQPKVIDFGVARSIDSDRTDSNRADSSLQTQVGQLVGTLQYMSPEQLDPGSNAGDVSAATASAGLDPRSDVYSLGLVLHEMLAGEPPYDLSRLSIIDAATVIREFVPRRLARIDRDVSVILQKSLEQNRRRRYADAGELAADLGRYLAGEAIHAAPPRFTDSIRRLARKHRAASAAIAGILASILLALAGISFFYFESLDDRARAIANQQAAERQAYRAKVHLAALSRDQDHVLEAFRLVADARNLRPDDPIELRCLEASLDAAVGTLRGHSEPLTAIAVSRDGRRVATASADATARIWDAATGKTLAVLAGHAAAVWAVAFSPDGALAATGSADKTIRIWDADSGETLHVLAGHSAVVYAVAFSPVAGRVQLASGSRDKTVRLWDPAQREQTAVLEGHAGTVYAVAFSPDGRQIASCSHDRTGRLWDAGSGEALTVLEGHQGRVFGIGFSPDSSRIVTASEDKTARVWSRENGGQLAVLNHQSRVNAACFSPDGREIAAASNDTVVRLWDAETAQPTGLLRGHTGSVTTVQYASDGLRAVSGSRDCSARMWDRSMTGGPAVRHPSSVVAAVFSPDSRWLVTASADSTCRLLDAAACEERAILGAHDSGRVTSVAFFSEGGRLVSSSDDGTARIWDVLPPGSSGLPAGRLRVALAGHEKRVFSASPSPDGRLVATASEDKTARIWDAATGTEKRVLAGHQKRVFCAAWSPSGRFVATSSEDRTARLWDPATGELRLTFSGHSGAVNWVAFSPDERLVATASSDATVGLWEVSSGRLVGRLKGHRSQVWKIAFSPDGSRLASASADGTARIWETASGEHLLTLSGHDDEVWSVCFSPDGTSIATASLDRQVRVFGVSTAQVHRARSGSAAEP